MTTTEQPFSPIVGDVITAMFEQSHSTTNILIDSLTRQAEDADATLCAVRDGIGALLGGDFMPTPAALARALWPSPAMVDRYRPARTA